ncbi:MAG TPA: CDGSH iron-sulfur domain-containing protein [Rhizomicrobium sp.]|jgi:CDGSH-type Zn-finger protein/mannose-6-phosphate isomerase-like protein (cupin superfamily)
MIPVDAPKIARSKGFYYEVKAGKRYSWCRCGRSANQPFCDGSHAGTQFTPMLFEAKVDEEVIFCGCKHTGRQPFCDGSHNNLPGATVPDDPDSAANKAIRAVPHAAEAQVLLDGVCFVFSTARAKLKRRGSMAYCPVIGPTRGAQFLSQFYAEIEEGISPVIGANGRDTVLFVSEGQGEVEISGRRFAFRSRTGIYVRPDESFRVHNSGPEKVRLFISNGPGVDELAWLDEMPANFDETHPNRMAEIDPSQRHAMAERYFQILVSREHGCTEMTQFIGNIPHSKAEPHRHLYEEAVIFLNGAGVVWTERTKTAVGPGDVLFLPRKLAHSVECTVDGGLDVVGVIRLGDNPSISY